MLIGCNNHQGNVAAVGFGDTGDVVAGGCTRGTHDSHRFLNFLGYANGEEGCTTFIRDALGFKKGVFIDRTYQGIVAVSWRNYYFADTLLLEHGYNVKSAFVIGVHVMFMGNSYCRGWRGMNFPNLVALIVLKSST